MGISSLGVGSSILTQDVIDQLKAADTAQFITPKDAQIKEQKDRSAGLDVIDALMTNVESSLSTLTEYGVFESRTADVSGTAVEVSAADSSDIQDFSLEVTTLANKWIEQSGTFTTRDAGIASGDGQLELNVGSETFTLDYTSDTKLTDLKDMINKQAGSSVEATIVQFADDDFRLFLSSKNTGLAETISLTDVVGAGESAYASTTTLANVQTGNDAVFNFNGLEITRASNTVDDLLSGVTITLKEEGQTSNVSVQQDRENITSKIENFIEKYNSAMYQLGEDTKSSQNADERGLFSGDSTIKGMKRALEDMLTTAGEGVARMSDYGIEVGDDGRLSLDSTILNSKLDENPDSVQAFLTGGSFVKADGTTTEVTGIFNEMKTEVDKYAKYNTVLDQLKTATTDRIESITEQKALATKRLDARYAIMAKRFAAYDAVINQLNTASSMFTELANAQIAANNS